MLSTVGAARRQVMHGTHEIQGPLFHLAHHAAEIFADHTELFKQFSDDPEFKRWVSNKVFGLTTGNQAAVITGMTALLFAALRLGVKFPDGLSLPATSSAGLCAASCQ